MPSRRRLLLLGGSSLAAVLGVAGYLRLCRRRARELIFCGQLIMFECVLRAMLRSLVTHPLRCLARRLFGRYLPRLLGEPTTLAEAVDANGKRWLTLVLRDVGQLGPKARVVNISAREFAAGQVGVTACLTVTYSSQKNDDDDDDDVPPSPPPTLVLKLSRPDFEGRVANQLVGLYREVTFFKSIARTLDADVRKHLPTCYYGAIDPVAKDNILLLADATYLGKDVGYVKASTLGKLTYNAACGKLPDVDAVKCGGMLPEVRDHVAPYDRFAPHTAPENVPRVVQEMKRAVVLASKLHAKYWMDERILDLDLSLHSRDSVASALALLQDDWAKTKVKARDPKKRVAWVDGRPYRGAADASAFEAWAEDAIFGFWKDWSMRRFGHEEGWNSVTAAEYKETLRRQGFTLCHGDLHTENIFLRSVPNYHGARTTTSSMVLLDWQLLTVADPTMDVARIVTLGGLDAHGRRLHEEEILRTWYDSFVSQPGVSAEDYSWDLAKLRFRYFACYHAALMISFSNVTKLFEQVDGAGVRVSCDTVKYCMDHYCGQDQDPRTIFVAIQEELRKLGRGRPWSEWVEGRRRQQQRKKKNATAGPTRRGEEEAEEKGEKGGGGGIRRSGG